MPYNFDEIIDRSGTCSIKIDVAGYGKPADALPLWVADMDFKAPLCVIDALEKQVRHGIFGYSDSGPEYYEAVRRWQLGHHGFDTQASWLVKTPGVVVALHIAVRGLTAPGDAVLIQTPVYHPFHTAATLMGRKLVANELVNEADSGKYGIDFDDFEAKIAQNNVKIFLLCSPHNPVGRVWTREELLRMGEICLRYGVTVVSDEIHQDFIFPGHRHTVFASLSPELSAITVTCTAPSKTFNLAGLMHSNIFIANPALRDAFVREYELYGLSQLGVLGLVACQAAYEGGADWLAELLAYLDGNLTLITNWAQSRPAAVKFRRPEGTYLAWMDFRSLGLSPRELDDLVTKKAKVWLSNGRQFGEAGAGFLRLNAASPRSVIEEALRRLDTLFPSEY
ncbi:aminotransferase [Clostridia bacterium]|nr:aminotransferase [Clostridia bacterium]